MQKTLRFLFILVLVVVALSMQQTAFPIHAQGVTFYVDRLDNDFSACTDAPNDCSLVGAIIAANANNNGSAADIIELQPGADYVLSSAVNVDANYIPNALPLISSTIIINGNDATIRLKSGLHARVMHINAQGNLTLNHTTIADGRLTFAGNIDLGNGAGIYNEGVLTLYASIVTNNTIEGSAFYHYGEGAGIYNTGSLTLMESVISDNRIPAPIRLQSGGGLSHHGTNLIIQNTRFSGNEAASGGAIGLYPDNASTVEIAYSTFENNTAHYAAGGAIFAAANFTVNTVLVTISNTTLAHNSAMTWGGAIAVEPQNFIFNLSDSTLSGNSGETGGAIYNNNSKVNLINTTISGNSATYAAAIYDASQYPTPTPSPTRPSPTPSNTVTPTQTYTLTVPPATETLTASPTETPTYTSTPLPTNTPPPSAIATQSLVSTFTSTPDCASGSTSLEFVRFDNFGAVLLHLTNNTGVPTPFLGFEIVWPEASALGLSPGKLTLRRISVGGITPDDYLDSGSGAVLMWQSTTSNGPATFIGDATPPTTHTEGSFWRDNYVFPPNSTTSVWLDFEGTPFPLDDAFGIGPWNFNGTTFDLGCAGDDMGEVILSITPEAEVNNLMGGYDASITPSPTYTPTVPAGEANRLQSRAKPYTERRDALPQHSGDRGTTITRSIISGNSSGDGLQCYGLLASGGHNLVGQLGNASGCPTNGGSDLVLAGTVDAVIAELTFNGGPTHTHALVVNSPAINAGGSICSAADQRGVPRDGACDIGAFEFQSRTCPDGTPNDDILRCEVNLPSIDNPDGRVHGYEGHDQITVIEGVTALSIIGDMMTFTNTYITGFDDTLINEGMLNFIIGDGSGEGSGGNDTITNLGTVKYIFGDFISRNLVSPLPELSRGGNDTITNEGFVNGFIYGDSIWDEGKGGDDLITNNGIVQADEFNIGGSVFGDTVAGDGGNDTIINNGYITGFIVGDEGSGAGGMDTLRNTEDAILDLDMLGDGSVGDGNTDTLTNDGFILGDMTGDATQGNGAADTITNNGFVRAYLIGDSAAQAGADDIIINNGTTQQSIIGDWVMHSPGSDQITNNGLVFYDIVGDGVYDPVTENFTAEGAADAILNNGTVGGAILAQGGDDTVTLQNGTRGGADNYLFMDGGDGFDTLVFDFTGLDRDTMQALYELVIVDATSGQVTVNGQLLEWVNFEQLQLTEVIFASSSVGFTGAGGLTVAESSGQYRAALALTTANGIYPLTSTVQARVNFGGTATNGVDYWPEAMTVTFTPQGAFPVGAFTSEIVVNIVNDTEIEVPEQVIMTISSVSLGTELAHTFTISDDDAPTPDSATPTPIPTDVITVTDEPGICPASNDIGYLRPALTWTRQENEFAEWYRLVLWNATTQTVAFDTWLQGGQICNGQDCTLSPDAALLPFGLMNGTHQLWLQAWKAEVLEAWRMISEFEVNVPLPIPPPNITIDSKTNRPLIRWTNDPNAQWYQVYIGAQDGSTVHLRWYEKTPEMCCGDTCALLPDAHPTNGNYAVYMMAWGPAGISTGNLQGWNGPANFTLSAAPPTTVSGFTVDTSGNHPVLSWVHSADATWYQVWLGITEPTSQAVLTQWFSAPDLNCLDDNICTLPDNLPLQNGRSHHWYVLAWGPGGFSTGGIQGWSEAPPFTP